MIPPFPVLDHFAAHTRGLTWRCASGGFSGARAWIGTGGRPVVLKEWPPGVTVERLRQIHIWMNAVWHLRFVPEAFGILVHGGRVWDCCRFVPGEPCAVPNTEEIQRACAAVAQLHDAWAAHSSTRGPSPGVQGRLRVLAENGALLRAGPDSLPPVSAALDPLLRRALEVVARSAANVDGALRFWEGREFLLHPCARDLRGEHVLFLAREVSGIIDYGAAAVDHAAGDLARLLNDYAHADASLFGTGLSAYRTVRPAFDAPDDFVLVLARADAVCSALGWLVRLIVRREPVSDATAVAARLSQLVARVERIAQF